MKYIDSKIALSHEEISENYLGIQSPDSSEFLFLDKAGPITVLASIIALKDKDVVIVLGSSICDLEIDFSVTPGLKIVIYTSGSTGKPKPVLRNFNELIPRKYQKGHLNLRWGLLFDYEKMAGLQVLLSAYYREEALYCPDSSLSLTEKIVFFVENEVNALSATPSLWRNILQLDLISKLNLRQITLGGEKSDNLLLREIGSRFPDTNVDQIYASSELGYVFSVKDARAGFPIHYLEKYSLRVSDSSELYVKKGDKWFPTGDLVAVLDDRYIFTGRVDAVVNIGGVKVDPIFVERAIMSIDGIRDAIVNGIRNPILGEILIAEVITTEESGLSEKIIRKRLGEQLDSVQIPAVIRIVENFTLNSNGKRGVSQ